MNLACCTWALSGDEKAILDQIADVGFDRIDIQPGAFQSPQSNQHLQHLGMTVSCVGLSFGLPEGVTFDSPDPQIVEQAMTTAKSILDDTTQRGIQQAYIIPGLDDTLSGLNRYGDAVAELTEYAYQRNITLSIEHFPGRALPSIRTTLDFVRAIRHPNLHLLLDVGHAQMSKEDIPNAIKRVGPWLGYVHLDDNDGVGDLHWALLDGVMTADVLQGTFAALHDIGYTGSVSLELSPELADPLDAIRRSWDIINQVNK